MDSVISKQKHTCTGCGLCETVCPKQCIKMLPDEEGFLYPKIEDTCVQCGLCLIKCPAVSVEKSLHTPLEYFILKHKSLNELMRSASGGAFTAISDYVLSHNGKIYGAVYSEDYTKVFHASSINSDKRDKMRDSKYVQSSIQEVFPSLQKDYESNKLILFTGTPCQCAAINEYYSVHQFNKDNLILCDLICHGVGSPKIWMEYINYISQKYHLGKIRDLIIRNKDVDTGYNMTICGDKSDYLKHDKQDPYIRLFSKNLILRPSCYECPFKNAKRVGDLSIGDFQKARKYYPEFNISNGVSVLFVNSTKGRTVFESIKSSIDYKHADKESAMQKSLIPTGLSRKERDKLFSIYNTKGFESIIYKYTEEGCYLHSLMIIKRIIKAIINHK